MEGTNTFAAPPNTTLNPQTNYFVTVNEATPPPTGRPGVPFAPGPRAVYELTGSREQSGADGWSIDDKRLYKNHLSQEWGTSNRIFLFIRVNGDVHTPNTEQQVEIVPPTVDGTPSVSGAGTDAQWSVGETVGVTVTFSEAVDVGTSGGTPSIGIGLGGTAARSATYASGTGTTELVFEYTLVSGDGSHGYMAVTPDSLALNGGTIRSAGSGVDALLAHNGALTSGNTERSTGPEASFQDVPKSHDGATAFTVGVQFSGEPAGLSATRDAASVLEVTGGSVTGARVTSQSANPAWEVTVAPDGLGEVTIEVPVRACTEANAVCIGGRSLSRAVDTTVPGSPMTARFTQTPSVHDGSNGFELHMEFSHEPENFSYRTVQGALFDIEGGRIERVWRRERGKGRQWGIVVAPDGGGAVTLATRATTDCAAQHAVCDAEGWKFAGDLSLTVPGPASPSLPVVSIAASTTPVTEGAAAAFTLSRTGATDAALTVSVSVSESEASVSGTPPTSVTFAAASVSVTLSVATEDDEVAEDASTVTAEVSSGSGYTVSGTSGTADVVVEDDDAAPVVTTASPIVVAENATAVATLSATDADTAAEDLSWSIPAGAAGGADAAKFALTTAGVLTFKAEKDYESPDDTDTDGDYEITVRVTDGVNPVDAALVVRLSDVDEVAPTLEGMPLTASFSGVPAEHDGTAFEIRFHLSEEPATLSFRTIQNGLFDVTGASIEKASRLNRGKNNGWTLRIDPSGFGDVTVRVKPTTACDTPPGVCTPDGRKLGGGLQVAIAGPAVLSIADAEVDEAEGALLDFVVTLSKQRYTATTAAYATSDGTATAGADYTEASGTVTFGPLETSKTVSVAVLDDSHDEGAETMTLTLSNPSGARLGDSTATGTINNTDAMPRAWMIRFGRTVGSQVVDALNARLDGADGSHVTVAGINLVGAKSEEPTLTDDDPFGLPEWAIDAEREADTRTITADDLLLRSAFHLSSGGDGAQGEGAAFTAWGRVSTGGFEAEEKGVTMDGDVTTGLVGFDAEWERALAGVMLSQNTGEGSYRLDPELGSDAGTVESSLTGVYPYARVDLSAKVSAWALAGMGSGELTLHQEGEKAMPTDISMRMGAVGVKGQVLDGSGASGLAMNVKTDAMWVGTKNDDTDELAPTKGDVTRLRLTLQGERVFEAGKGATFTPSAEIGLRHDGGDAETGTGIEVGAGLRYTAGPLTVEGQVRTLVAHEDSDYEEWGMSGAIRVTPSPSGRGLTLAIAPAWGRTGSAAARLWSAHDARALGADSEFEADSQIAIDTGYGFALPGSRGVLTPYAGLTLGDGGHRTVRTGSRWQLGPDAVVSVEATRQASDASEADNEVRLRAALRF